MGRKLKLTLITLILIILSGLNLSYAQQAINGSRYILGYWDASQARWTKPFLTSASQPATCAVGEVMFDTDATAGQNIYLCTATDTWTQVTGGSGPGASPGGSSGNVQYNNGSGGFGAEAALTYDSTTNILASGKIRIVDTCTLGASTTVAAGTLCFGGTTDGMLASDGSNWWTSNWSQNASGEVWYSGSNYNPTSATNFAFVANVLSVPTIKPTTSIRGTASNVINLDPDSDGTIESNFDASGNFSGNAATATSATTAGSATTATTAGALSADGTNCSAGQAPLGVDASGNSQSCFTPTATQVDIDGDGTREVSLSASTLYADPDEDGKPSYKFSSTALSFDTNEDGTYAGQFGETGGYSSSTFMLVSDLSAELVADNNEDGTGSARLRVEGKNSLVWDGLLVDCDGDGSALGYDVTTGLLVCGDDDTGGAGTQVDIDADGTREISLATSILSLDPDEDGTLESNFDANGRFSSSAVSLDDDRDALLAVWAEAGSGIVYINPDEDGSKWRFYGTDFLYANSGGMQLSSTGNVRVDPTDDGTAQEIWDGSANTIQMDLDQDGTWEYSFDGSTNRLYIDIDDDGTVSGSFKGSSGDITGDGTNEDSLSIATASDMTYSPFINDPRYAFSQFKDCTTLDIDVDVIPVIEGTVTLGATAAQLDANPQTGLTAFGYCSIPTGATSGNEFQIGWGTATDMRTNSFIINKTTYFGTRLKPAAITDASAVWVHVGAADYNADNALTARTDALMFQCSPWADLDGDGTMGSLDTDGTGTTAPDGDCADANEDSDDCNWYVVSINGATSTNDNGCLLDVDSDGSGDCDRDGTEDDAVTQTNRTAYNTGVKCNGDVGNDGTWAGTDGSFQTLEIVSTSPTNATYSFRINGVQVYALSTNVPGNARTTSGWSARAETNMAVTRTWLFDWMGWSSKRLTN
jgi:hypothetical protein